ncbi:uncharacterized protein LOC129913510 isoform X2 [Episyrphus balteatus]|uniref:uncharacterized protein LOC129913510 isoform X2 n=1 Tax=Episyrphus balteatus TaxID=286459 RepID=UPI00248678D5|nr:uncharacterized protein LOC129913510 isoform X2 [Episyrphus balteatus]
MDFPQQIEETLAETPMTYDVVMESLFERKHTKLDSTLSSTTALSSADLKMSSSLGSNLEDTTPSDSGVQTLDSESSSELMIDSITSQTGFDFEDLKPLVESELHSNQLPDLVPNQLKAGQIIRSDMENSNVSVLNGDDVMTTSNCSTFDGENIVYRRRIRKPHTTTKTPKKRVSFHEDILKNTRTDNIHIEHGFVTYKNGRKAAAASSMAGRYSWCSEGDAGGSELCNQEPDDPERRVVYRNACSDVLDYGNSDIYENNDSNYLKYDNSGVFEYHPQHAQKQKHKQPEQAAAIGKNDVKLYKCSCSSSNSSLDSDEMDKNSNSRSNYAQAKSNSCDCIGMNHTNNNFINDNCYFSEPNIDNLNEGKSVWNKEKRPKTSCLKKTKRHTNIIHEQDLNTKVKKFNVHDMNNLIDNSKMIFGSLKSIFAIPLPERGVPEGSEDLQSVYECIPEADGLVRSFSPIRAKPFLSKSLDGSKDKNKSKFVHNVDQQLRRKNEEDMFAPTRQNSADDKPANNDDESNDELEQKIQDTPETQAVGGMTQFRNKFIINCESTVFEHTGVSYTFESYGLDGDGSQTDAANSVAQSTPLAQSDQEKGAFMSVPNVKQTFANIFRTLKETATSPTAKKEDFASAIVGSAGAVKDQEPVLVNPKSAVTTTPSEPSDTKSMCSDMTSSTSSWQKSGRLSPVTSASSNKNEVRSSVEKQNRHLPSPMKKRAGGACALTTVPARFEHPNRMSPDLFNLYSGSRGGCGRDSKSTILSEEFDDILTITTDTDKNESDIVIVDYPEASTSDYTPPNIQNNNLLKPQTKTSLINRFLRNVTQKKIIETTIRKNNFFAGKIKNEQKLFSGNLYVKGVKPKNIDLIEDLNAEIAMEIEMSAANSPRRELVGMEAGLPGDISRFELGIGEISIDIFNGNYLHILRNDREILMKVFKLYTGYSREGFMTPVLVFLTDKTLYVADLVRNRLCSKFVLPYSELDVILMGPYGNTVLLSNCDRDMQQVLLAGGPYPADGLVANLELCARRGGSILPAVGQLTLQHLSPLQAFVRENSSVTKDDIWMYYAVINIPAGTLGIEEEPLGPHVKGFLMHRRIREHAVNARESWHPGYFLLKAGVLYMFHDSTQKLPTWAMALAECQGARRSLKAGRPHCFEILLRNQLLQLAAPDEYVASEWLQALLQSASGLFEMQEKHKTLGCSLIVTQNHLITLREDFSAPLRQMNKSPNKSSTLQDRKSSPLKEVFEANVNDTSSVISSAMSTPTRNTGRSNSSLNSTPTRLSQTSQSTITTSTNSKHHRPSLEETSSTNMSSVYGKNSGIEILTCADIKEMTGIKIPSHNDTWWCVLEFSCQEVRESSDDLVIFFASSSEMQRFLRMLEHLWQAKNNDLFPITVLDEDDSVSEQCTALYMDIQRSWEPLLSAALGYPL